jgi:hypothetical protein
MMPRMKKIVLLLGVVMALHTAKAQIQTITVASGSPQANQIYMGQTLTIPANYYARLMSFIGPNALLQIQSQGMSVLLNVNSTSLSATPVVIAGPATFQIEQSATSAPGSFATVDVEPGPFPPGKTATIGANAGDVQVTMQTSTDLVNWTTAVNGQTYTNSPAAQFFRIQMTVNP